MYSLYHHYHFILYLCVNFASPEALRVKLSGDGTWLGSKLHAINFTFNFPDFPDTLTMALHNIVNECKDPSYVKVHDKI